MSWMRSLLVAVLLMVGLGAVGVGLYTQSALPLTDGRLVIEGLRADVRIERDRHGIPTIRAASFEDATFGLGFVHAQDRLWQMETHRRIAAGRLAEAFGESALASDRFLRSLQVRQAAQAQWQTMSGETRTLVLAYTAGVNAAVRLAVRARPPEFVLLGLEPEPWDPVDCLAWAIMMAWDLGSNWSSELLRLRLAQQWPVERIEALLPASPGESARLPRDLMARLQTWQVAGALDDGLLARLADAAPPSGIEGTGSNNWVVGPSRSESRGSLLANDPHLKLGAPSLWYLARLMTPELEIAGATLPGLPAVVLGQNRHLAWGYTNTGTDVQDLYLERLDPRDPARYRTPEGWAPFDEARETIRVRGGADVPVTLRRSRHGPVISDADGRVGGVAPLGGPSAGFAIALRWTALDPDPGTIVAGLKLQRARTVDEFIAAASTQVAPMQNMLVADREGRIAFVAAGRVPRRGPGHDLHGLLPAPGWEPRYDWQGFLEPEQTPREVDPARDWLATANQRIHGDDYPFFLTSEWAAPYRQQRIEQLLQARPRHTVDSFAAMQADTVSPAAAVLLPWLRAAQGEHRLRAAAQHELIDFDGDMRADRAAPLIYWAWVRQLTQAVFADDLGPALFEATFGGRSFRDALEGVLARRDDDWCDDRTTPDVRETCAAQAEAALGRALDELAALHGERLADWRWGDAHVARAEHRPFSRVAGLASLFELRAPVGGDTYTINASRVGLRPDPRSGERYLNEHGPALRAIYDLAEPRRSRVMLSTGQSGVVFSRHYRDLLPPWRDNAYVSLWPADGEAVHLLELQSTRTGAGP